MLSICIVTYNSASYINKCISSINAFTKDVDYEFIVVDNNSSDKTPRYIKENLSKAKLIELECNLGFSKANNIAAHHSSGDVLLFINPDTEVRDNAIGVMYEHLKMSENAALGCKLVYPDGAIQRTCART